MRIAHIITRMIIGSAQENTLLNCLDLIHQHGDDVLLITGPAIGPEGDLLGEGRAGELPIEMIPSLRRSIHPIHDWNAHAAIAHALRRFKPDVVHTHSAKGGLLGRSIAWKLCVPAVIHTVHGGSVSSLSIGAGSRIFSTLRKVGRPTLPPDDFCCRRHD